MGYISWQGLWSLVGVAIAFILIQDKKIFAHNTIENRVDRILCFLFELIGIVIGAKLLYVALNIKDITLDSIKDVISFILVGFSFYGGLFLGIGFIWIYCKCFRLSFLKMLNDLIITFPIIYAFMKIGCFFTGCCYGIKYTGLFSILCRSGLDRFPVQILDFLIHMVIVVVLFTLYRKGKNMVMVFFILHAVERFFVEYLRADETKDMLKIISVNQLISSLIVVFCLIVVIYQRYRTQHLKAYHQN